MSMHIVQIWPYNMQTNEYRALQVTCQRLEAWLSCCDECHKLNLFKAAPNLIKALHNLV